MDWIKRKSMSSAAGGSGVPVPAEEAAAGMLMAAATMDGSYTEVERDRVTKTMMKLFQLSNPAAGKVQASAEALIEHNISLSTLAEAARSLESDIREKLVARLWDMLAKSDGDVDAPSFIYRIADVWGMPRDRAKALRAIPEKEGSA